MAAEYEGADAEVFEPVRDDGSPMLKAGLAEVKVVSGLTSCLKLAKMYSVENVVVRDALVEFHTYLVKYLSFVDVLSIQIGNDRVYVNNAAVRMGAVWLDEFIDYMARTGINGFEFRGVWSYEAAEQILESFGGPAGNKTPEQRYLEISARVKDIPAPAVLAVSDEVQISADASDGEDELSDAALGTYYYARLLSLVEETHAEVHRGSALDVHRRFIRHTLMKLVAGLKATFFEQRLLALTGTEPSKRDPLASHATNVAILSIAMGRLLDLSSGELVNLGFAALFHDAGRVLEGRFPNPPGASEDRDQAEQHVAEGLRMGLGGGLGDAELSRLFVIQEHHRQVDGYPDSKGLPKPHLFSRIVAVADAFDKLQNGTPWWPAVNPAEAMRTLLRTPDKFETPVAELLRDVIGKTPRGTVLELKSGELVMVMDGGARWGHRPVVRRLFVSPGKADPDRTLKQVKSLSAEVARELDPATVNVDWRREVRNW